MKMSLIGGGGVRTPYFVESLAKYAEVLGVTRLTLMDNDEEKLTTYGALAQWMAEQTGARVNIELTTDPIEAVRDAAYVVTTLRVGQDQARVLDETIALKYGVLGQETTGAGGCMSVSYTHLDVYKRQAVSNGEEAMDFVRTQPVDVALIDIKMPRMDGVALSAQLAAEFPEICKILISGYGEFAYAQQAIRYKVYRYLLKPTDPEELCSILEQLAAEMDRQRMTKPEDVQLLWESFFHRPDVTGAARLAKALPSAAAGILLVCPEQGALKPTLNPLTGWAAHREDGRTAILLPLEAHAPTGVAKAYFEDLSHRAAKTLSGAWSFGGRDEILKTLISAERKLDGMFYAPGRLIEVLEPLGLSLIHIS